MEKVGSLKTTSEIVRRVAPLKIMIGLLYRELDAAKGEAVNLDRALFESVITTLECAVEDVEARAGTKTEERRLVDSTSAPRIAAPRA